MTYETEFQHCGLVFAVRFEVEGGMPKNLVIYTWDNDLIPDPLATLYGAACAAASRFIVDERLV